MLATQPPPRSEVPPGGGLHTLIDQFLAEQSRSAVETFSQWHEVDTVPTQSQYYSLLLPAAPPGPGEQYAFEVDLDACSGCKACVAACHSLNGLDEGETWRDVGLLLGGTASSPVMQHLTSACHHCLDPACLNVCPVRAYEKDAATGIVSHLDDQCIGCQYCTFACPYDVPKYSHKRGIVRKCDMCSQRLAVREAPACVQGCPNAAIRITTVKRQDVIENSEAGLFVPGTPDPAITLPTTNFKTSKSFPRNLLPADYFSAKREHAHWPLILMLVLTQLSVGAFLVELLMQQPGFSGLDWGDRPMHAAVALVTGLVALGASTMHLGRPLYAFRAVLGLRTSWLSREILAFGIYAGLAVPYAGWTLWGGGHSPTHQALGLGVVTFGLGGVLCSIMIYQCTRRALWSGFSTGLRFGLCMVLLGLAAALWTSLLSATLGSRLAAEVWHARVDRLCLGLIVVSAAKLLYEASVLTNLRDRQNTPLKRSALLMTRDLAGITFSRFMLGLLGGVALPAAFLTASVPAQGWDAAPTAIVVTGLFACAIVGELLERYLFFAAVVAPRMPGGLST